MSSTSPCHNCGHTQADHGENCCTANYCPCSGYSRNFEDKPPDPMKEKLKKMVAKAKEGKSENDMCTCGHARGRHLNGLYHCLDTCPCEEFRDVRESVPNTCGESQKMRYRLTLEAEGQDILSLGQSVLDVYEELRLGTINKAVPFRLELTGSHRHYRMVIVDTKETKEQ